MIYFIMKTQRNTNTFLLLNENNYAFLRSLEEELNKEFRGAWISAEKMNSQSANDINEKYDPSANDTENYSSNTSPNSQNFEEEKQTDQNSYNHEGHVDPAAYAGIHPSPYAQPAPAVSMANYGNVKHDFYGGYHGQNNQPANPAYYGQYAQPNGMVDQNPSEQVPQQPAPQSDGYYGVTQIMTQPQTTYEN